MGPERRIAERRGERRYLRGYGRRRGGPQFRAPGGHVPLHFHLVLTAKCDLQRILEAAIPGFGVSGSGGWFLFRRSLRWRRVSHQLSCRLCWLCFGLAADTRGWAG